MNKTNILIVEDQKLHLAKTIEFCSANGYEVLGHADNVSDAFRLSIELKPQVVLVDIKLRNGDCGIDYAKAILKIMQPNIIFLSSYFDDALIRKASETNPAGYLVKPFDAASLKATIELCHYRYDVDQKVKLLPDVNGINAVTADHFFVKVGNMFKKIAYEDIIRIQSSHDKYTDLELAKGRIISVRHSLNQMEEILPNFFWRIHRAHIVNSDKIEAIDAGRNVLQVAGQNIPIGRSYRKLLNDRFRYVS